MQGFMSRWLKVGGGVLLGLACLAGIGLAVMLLRPSSSVAADDKQRASAASDLHGIELVAGMEHTLRVPADVQTGLGIRTHGRKLIAVVQTPRFGEELVMPGSTALDPARLYRVRARFAPSPSSAKCVEIGQAQNQPDQRAGLISRPRPLRSGDFVHKGDLLAVFNSVDVGNTKSGLVDAICQLKLDDEILKRAEVESGSVPEAFIWNARRQYQGDVNTVNKTVNTLRAWDISEADIQAVRDEAENVEKRKGKHDKDKEARWGRVELRAPDDGVIVEMNLTLDETVVDNTTNLFQIAKVDQLWVYAYPPEDDLQKLEALKPSERFWTVQTVDSQPISGFIDDIRWLIDPNQHTGVVTGHITNPTDAHNLYGRLRAGQFITAKVKMPAPKDVVEAPISAVVDDGQQAVVFVQADPEKHPDRFTMRRVVLKERFADRVFVSTRVPAADDRTSAEKELGILPKAALLPNEHVICSGVDELKAALVDKESEPKHTES